MSLKNILLVLICGGSCSGKTTLARGVAAAVSARFETSFISMDDYYYDLSSYSDQEIEAHNFDSPAALDSAKLVRDISRLKSGVPIPRQSYDFVSHKVTLSREKIIPGQIIITEGIFALHYPELRKLAELKVFIKSSEELRVQRRLSRDSAERGLNNRQIIDQFHNSVRPMHEKYIWPSAQYADLILNAEDKLQTKIKKVVEAITCQKS